MEDKSYRRRGYGLQSLYYISHGKNHIPYLIAGEVIGPQGGRYLLDEFNLEWLAKATVSGVMTPKDMIYSIASSSDTEKIMVKATDRINKCATSDEIVVELKKMIEDRKNCRITLLQRKSGIETTAKISENFWY